ncbi:ABC transporter permease [Deinococcus peraridilitoris]|uniref:ABC-type dipeptide/oligopeptide/nickel transport system, permease component n=1 Tax=Deinococcus peraridilitoris (strain DSM 19664 / LMG 22246 / CIP 109416 / KR-200) TaxID=937777 RepID=L0A8N8_DEIPD|nr:ABC transporter permease [Deinococcus peraridilitoris]AFZ69440.1 ABC-type dipeptide/oligopeptide/nickel transport system, permease component [Deinococcus peraridilitoris DSM 19664]
MTTATLSPSARSVRKLSRNPTAMVSLFILTLVTSFAFLGPLVYLADPEAIDFARQFAPPSFAHPLGTDENGRDILIRLMLGGRVSLTVGFAAVAISLFFGVLLGGLAGYHRGLFDSLVMRFTDGMLAIPAFFIALLALTFFGTGLLQLVLVIGLTSWMGLARLVRGEILRYREELVVEAARALGAGDSRILARHVLPQVIPTVIVYTSVGISYAILTESALSFLGLGIQPPAASWGNMLNGAQNYIYSSPWLAVYPGALILLTVLAFNLLGDGLRDATDPNA